MTLYIELRECTTPKHVRPWNPDYFRSCQALGRLYFRCKPSQVAGASMPPMVVCTKIYLSTLVRELP